MHDLALIALVLGTAFMSVASLGVLRLREFYQRAHAPTKAATLGLLLLLVAVALRLREEAAVTKAVLAMLFIGATTPIGIHVLTRSAYRSGVPPSPDTVRDDYAGHQPA